MKVIWYWPMMRLDVHDEPGSEAQRYMNCIEATWEPSGERHGWVDKEAAIFSWRDVPAISRSGHFKSNSVSMHGVQTESLVKIPNEAKPHILEYIAMQMEGMDDERLESELEFY